MKINGKECEEAKLEQTGFCVLLDEAIKNFNQEHKYENLETLLKTFAYGCLHRERIIAAAEFAQNNDGSNAANTAENFKNSRLRYLVNENKDVFSIAYTSMDSYKIFPSDSVVELFLYDVLVRVGTDETVKALVINPNTDLCFVAEKDFIKAVVNTVNENLK